MNYSNKWPITKKYLLETNNLSIWKKFRKIAMVDFIIVLFIKKKNNCKKIYSQTFTINHNQNSLIFKSIIKR